MQGSGVATQHKPVVFLVQMKKRREVKSRDQKIIRWESIWGNVGECKERIRSKYEQLSEEAQGLEEVCGAILGNCRSFV